MDKVIIDEVDVSECARFIEGNHYCELGGTCDGSDDCYYKQLKRLQAEYDDLHLNYAGCKTANTGLQELNEKLQQENERLKQEINKLHRKLYCYAMDKECKDGTVECKQKNCAIKLYPKYKSELQRLEQENAELKAENERLKETEKEISDFISDISTCGFKYDDRCPDNLDELQQCIEDLCNKFDNYSQALQEIRDIAGSIIGNANATYTGFYNKLSDILDKINEVIGAEE